MTTKFTCYTALALLFFFFTACTPTTQDLTPEPAGEKTQCPKDRIAFVSDRDGNDEIYMVNADGTGMTRLTNNFAPDSYPRWSPDGCQIAFTSLSTGYPELYVLDVEKAVASSLADGLTQLTNTPEGEFEPAWSPDGQHLVFVSVTLDAFEISTIAVDGTNLRTLTDRPAIENFLFLVTENFCEEGDETCREEYSNELQDLPSASFNPAWSPDGQKIAFTSGPCTGDSICNFGVYAMNVDGSELTRLSENTEYYLYDAKPFWSADSQQVSFGCGFLDYRVCTANLHTGERSSSNLLTFNPNFGSLSGSSNGKQVVFSSYSHDQIGDIFVMNTDGSGLINLTNSTSNDLSPIWLLNGQITFVSEQGDNNEIYVVNPDGSGLLRLTDASANDHFSAMFDFGDWEFGETYTPPPTPVPTPTPYSFAYSGPWEEVGEGSASNGGFSSNDDRAGAPSLTIAPDGAPFFVWANFNTNTERREIYAWNWNDSNWTGVGASADGSGGISPSNSFSFNPSIALTPDGTPFVAWSIERPPNGYPEIYVRVWDGNTWAEVGAGSASEGGISNTANLSQSPSIAISPDGTPYVAWAEMDLTNNASFMFVRSWDGNRWVEVGPGSASGEGIGKAVIFGAPVLAIAPNGTPYVAWEDGNYEIYLKAWNGTSWIEVGTGSASGGGFSNTPGFSDEPSLAVGPDGKIYAAWMDNSNENYEIYIRAWDGTSWTEVGSGSATGGGISNNPGKSTSPALVISPDGTPYIAWQDDSSGNAEIYIRAWDGNSWVEVGVGSATGGGVSNNPGSSTHPSLAIAPNGTPYVAWVDDSSGTTKVYILRFVK